MNTKPDLTGELIQQVTESLSRFIQWIAKLILDKNWFTLLILIAVVGLFVFNPSNGFLFRTLGIEGAVLPTLYKKIFWLAEIGLITVALIVAITTMPRQRRAASQEKTNEPKIIKGLRPFEVEDAVIFAKLQRQNILRECLNSITSSGFKFGIIYGESGCGKTSFLQAGVQPRLMQEGSHHRGIYVRFSAQDPVLTIAKSIAEQLEIPFDWLLPTQKDESDCDEKTYANRLLHILSVATDSNKQSLILLFDQFEQFFTHYKRKEEQFPFINALAAWYLKSDPLSVRILVSIRSDLMYQLGSIYKALGCSLGAQEMFELEKLTPKQATDILGVIADAEGLDFNRQFTAELADEELADRKDGRISPVNLQVLAWMLGTQTTQELRAFNRNSFEKIGGVEGLLQRFLEKTLNAQVIPSQRQNAVKVLLVLIDQEQQVRSGELTESEIEERLNGTAQSRDIQEAVHWLAQGNVRLITPQESDGAIKYQLAHERLIPALMRQAGKELSAVDKANQLLDRRVNEWLGNHRNSRYLLDAKELLIVENQRPHIRWGKKREQKENLLRQSQRKLKLLCLGVGFLISAFVGGIAWLWYSPTGQMQRIKGIIFFQLRHEHPSHVADIATAFVKNNDWNTAFFLLSIYSNDKSKSMFIKKVTEIIHFIEDDENAKLSSLKKLDDLANQIDSNMLYTVSLCSLAEAYADLDQYQKFSDILDKALESARKIENVNLKSEAFIALSKAYKGFDNSVKTSQRLVKLSSVVQDIQDEYVRANVMHSIAQIYGELEDSDESINGLEQVFTSAQTIQDEHQKSRVIGEIAQAYGELNDSDESINGLEQVFTSAQTIQDEHQKSRVIGEIAQAYGELNDSDESINGLEQVFTSAQTIQDEHQKSHLVQAIAQAYGKLDDSDAVLNGLEQLFKYTQSIQNDELKTDMITSIAQAYGELNYSERAMEGLKQVFISAQKNQDERQRTLAIVEIVGIYGKSSNADEVKEALAQVFRKVQIVQDDYLKEYIVRSIANVCEELIDSNQANNCLTDVLFIAQTIKDLEWKALSIARVAQAYIKLGELNIAVTLLQQAIKTAQTIQNESWKTNATISIATAYQDLRNFHEASRGLGQLLDIAQALQDDESKSRALYFIARSASLIPNTQSTASLLDKVRSIAKNEKVIGPRFLSYELYRQKYEWEKALNVLPVKYSGSSVLSEMVEFEAERKKPMLIPGSVILNVEPSTKGSNYELAVTLKKSDEDCSNRMDWLEIITPEGKLLHREFPEDLYLYSPSSDSKSFLLKVSDLNFNPEQEVFIRTHYSVPNKFSEERLAYPESHSYRSSSGYNDQAFKGSFDNGFKMVHLSRDFARWLEVVDPPLSFNSCVEP